ncbi:GerAB/ArcD/ProY family transporter [Pseudogracilibacillus auburnensis]|uniref:Spore germination protein (Amino acid permease) n=1 Tax=Pseudogracilibacillus auburnensis TaxID=1494959 RepID=A0A2V3WKP2_9BACI|nr:GerAB/ArcD/ProY family transporter [Pseudogracilibacillus auburnensis]MBO1003592.1 GerAB/ArcD/ProY family transporter [Pseudogracilibacillus auburnensis]PXW89279.1 spore germination protein (amino acid permease) [Pseudogracilibacillus auburnensis]
MDKANYKIGTKEFVATMLLIIGISVSDDTSAILFQTMKNTAWMQPILSAIIIIIPLILLIKVVNVYKDKDMSEIIIHLFGKYIGSFTLFALWVLLTIRIIIESAIYTNIIETMFYSKTPPIVIYIFLMVVCGYIAIKGAVHITSIAWVVLPAIKISFLTSLLLTIGYGNLNFLFPILGPGEKVIMKESFLKASIYIDFLFLCFLLPYLKNRNVFQKASRIALPILIVELAIAFIIFLIFFDYSAAKLQNFPYHEILRYIHVGFLTNMESFFFPFWLMATFVRFSIYIYINLHIVRKVFKIERTEFLMPGLLALVILIGLIPDSPSFTLFNMKLHYFNILSPIFIVFPFLLWIVAYSKGDFKSG